MAEICLDCWNKINGTDDPPSKYILSEGLDLCEVCGECKNGILWNANVTICVSLDGYSPRLR